MCSSDLYTFVSNAIVTQQVLKESPLFGNGLGSHQVSHARFLDSIPGVEYFSGMGLQSMNDMDAGSLTFRVLSEFGILGYLGVLFFVFHFHVGGNGPRAAISNGILVCFLLKLIRSGEYYQPEQFFFIFIYILNYRKFMSESSRRPALPIRKFGLFGLGRFLRRPRVLPTRPARNVGDIRLYRVDHPELSTNSAGI